MRSFVIKMPRGFNDPDECIIKGGRELFKKEIESATPLPIWLINIHLDWENKPMESFDRIIKKIKSSSPVDSEIIINVLSKKINIETNIIKSILEII